jgi:hypothetical protein
MKRVLYLLVCMSGLVACAAPVTTSQRTEIIHDNKLQITSGTFDKGRFVSVANAQKVWEARLKGGKEKWILRRDLLRFIARKEIEHICGSHFVAIRKGPIYNMLDNDETMGGVAPALGVSVAMLAYIAAEAATLPTNIPASVYMEFSCQKDEK